MNRKLKSLSVIIACAVLFNIVAYADSDYTTFQDTLERVFVLDTTLDPDRTARLTADGDVIYAEGYFKDCEVVDLYISGANLSGANGGFTQSLADDVDGARFTAYYGGVPSGADSTNARVILKLDDGTTLGYRVEYNSEVGWFFGDNGIAEDGMTVLGNYHEIPPDISAYYVSATLDPDEIEKTRAELKKVVDEVTLGIDEDDDYQRAKALNQWVADNFYYDYDARDGEVTEETVSIYNTLRLQRSVCIGLGNLYTALLEAAGIKALNIKGGIASNAEGYPYETLTERGAVHEWVAFWYEAESRWVYADPTWDRRGIYEDGEYISNPPVMKHFDISPLALSFDHRGDRAEHRNYFGEFEDVFETSAEIESEAGANEPPQVTVQAEEPLVLPPTEVGQAQSDVTIGAGMSFSLYLVAAAALLAIIILITMIIKSKKQ